MTSDDPLYLGVLIHLRQTLKGRDADDPPMDVWQSFAAFTAQNTVMEPAEPTLVAGAAELRCPPGPLRAYQLVAHVGKVQRPLVERLPVLEGVSGSVEVTRATIIDSTDEALETLPIVDAEIVRRLRHRQGGAPCTLTVMPIALPQKLSCKEVQGGLDAAPRRIYIHIIDVDEHVTSLDRVAVSPDEREWAKHTVEHLVTERLTVQQYLVESLIEGLGIRGIDRLPYMLDLLEFVALQACSCDRIDGASGRLHGLVLSPPGAGKKLLARGAAALNPHSEHVSAAKVSAAGLIGNAHTGRPGALVRASGGVVCMPDTHELRTSTLGEVAYILQELIEDGSATDSKSTRTPRREANTATLLDMNEPTNRSQSILAKRAYISRVDVAYSIDADAARTWDVARERVANAHAGGAHLDDRNWERPVRVLVAYLRDQFGQDVDLSAARPTMAALIDGLREANKNAHVGIINDVVTRLPNSLTRLVAARAVACARSYALPEDVAAVEKFVRAKLEFVKLAPPAKAASAPAQPTPEAFIRDEARANGNRVELSALVKAYAEKYPRPFSRKTFQRAGQAMGAVRIGHGVYELPPPPEDDANRDVQVST